ncbi:AAA family ATPase [Cohnella suwonensis]|uniref:AAA family ATPase n=1 Tax=Cohnella suwonensis TaxID=696072 RepID=A0ABW0LZR9_9BACL
MRIKELQVDGYGALRAVKLALDTSVTVLYGPNEAGKSTLLRFVRSMLYGFPTRKDLVERGEPVNGGRHGGRLLIEEKDGRTWVLERYAERSGELVLRDGNGFEKTIGQAEWEKAHLGGISERLFRQLFAVSLNELHELRTLQGEEVGNYLYHAGLAGGTALTGARRKIAAEMDKLYRPKGSTQEMSKLLAEMKAIEIAIRERKDRVLTYVETEEELARLKAALAEAERELPMLRLDAARLQAAGESRQWWLKRETLLAEDAEARSRLANPDAPLLAEDAAFKRERLTKAKEEAERGYAEARGKAEEWKERRARVVWDEALAASASEWARLDGMREAISAKREERTELEAERRTLNEAVHSAISRISANWGETELLAFGGLAAEREQIRALQLEWADAEKTRATLQAELQRLARTEAALAAEADAEGRAERNGGAAIPAGSAASTGTDAAVVESFGLFAPRAKPALLQAWHRAEDSRRDFERARTAASAVAGMMPVTPAAEAAGGSTRSRSGQATGRTRKTGRSRNFLFGVASAALALVFASIYLFGGSDGPGAIGSALIALAFVIASAVSFRAASPTGAADRGASEGTSAQAASQALAELRLGRKKFGESLRQLLRHPETAAGDLGVMLGSEGTETADAITQRELLRVSPTEDESWQRLRDAVYEQLERFEASERGEAKLSELLGRLQETRREREFALADATDSRDRQEKLREEWRQWLEERKLPANLEPDGLPELLGLAEQGQVALRRRNRVAERVLALDAAIGDYEAEVGKLREACEGEGVAGAAATENDAARTASRLARESSAMAAEKAEAERLDRLSAESASAAEEAAGRLAAAQAGIAAMLEETGERSESELDVRLAVDGQSRARRREAGEIRIRLESGKDEDAKERLYELLRSYDAAELSAMAVEGMMRLEAAEQVRSERLDRRGRLAQELERQRGDAELEDSAQRLRELQGKLEALTERYAVLALSERLIARTKAVFEEEKQPEVLMRASRHFRRMTDGAYVRIVAPGETKAMLAETADKRLLDSAFLSRGTQEQLYLAMRFALCEAASPDRPLPLLLDDLFVHFDEKRLQSTIPVIGELSRTRQVILFTCHESVARAISSGLPEARMLVLGS